MTDCKSTFREVDKDFFKEPQYEGQPMSDTEVVSEAPKTVMEKVTAALKDIQDAEIKAMQGKTDVDNKYHTLEKVLGMKSDQVTLPEIANIVNTFMVDLETRLRKEFGKNEQA